MNGRQFWVLKITPVVEAEQISRENLNELVGWSKGEKLRREGGLPGLKIPTLHGIREGYEGDYLVKEMNGDFNVVRSHAFESKYTPLPETNAEL